MRFATGKPFLVDRLEHGPSFGVVEGHVAWEIRNSKKFYSSLLKSMGDHPFGMDFELSASLLSVHKQRNVWLIREGFCEEQERVLNKPLHLMAELVNTSKKHIHR